MLDILLLITLVICLITDLKNQKIYNAVLVPALFFGILLNVFYSGWFGVLEVGKGFLVGFLFLIIPFILGGIGAGDVKLLATIGAIKGPQFVFYTFLGMGIAGGLIALSILLWKRRLGKVFKNIGLSFWMSFITRFKIVDFSSDAEKNMFPYGVAITIGALVAYVVG